MVSETPSEQVKADAVLNDVVSSTVESSDRPTAVGQSSSSALVDDSIARAQRGELDALEALCQEHWLSVYRAVYRGSGSRADAEELTQEVFLRALTTLHRYHESGGTFGAYLGRIARNLLIDRWRTRRGAPGIDSLDTDPVSAAPDPEAVMLAQEERQSLLAALDALPERYSDVLRLRLLEGRSAREVGELWAMTPNAIRQLQFRALEALRARLGPREESP